VESLREMAAISIFFSVISCCKLPLADRINRKAFRVVLISNEAPAPRGDGVARLPLDMYNKINCFSESLLPCDGKWFGRRRA
jgi:hypothetical protein